MKKKTKIIITISLLVFFLCLVICAGAYLVTHGLYKGTNYVSDEDAMSSYVAAGEEEELSPEESQGIAISAEEESEIERMMREFANSEPVTNDGNVYNVLLIGVDRRDRSWAGNSDSMILMSLNYEKKQISMISLMRDTYVDIPGIGMRKLNAAHANGAGPLLLETVTQNYKIQVDRYASVDFTSMIDIVDQIGGIELELTEAEANSINASNPDSVNKMKAGNNMCDGAQAVSYARIRKIGNADYQRTERQRIVLTKILEKLKALSLTELYDFVETVLPLVTHNIPEDEMWSLLAKSPSILQYNLVKDRIPYDGMYKIIYVRKQDMLVPDWPETISKLKKTLY